VKVGLNPPSASEGVSTARRWNTQQKGGGTYHKKVGTTFNAKGGNESVPGIDLPKKDQDFYGLLKKKRPERSRLLGRYVESLKLFEGAFVKGGTEGSRGAKLGNRDEKLVDTSFNRRYLEMGCPKAEHWHR